jgi:hypothetical protein
MSLAKEDILFEEDFRTEDAENAENSMSSLVCLYALYGSQMITIKNHWEKRNTCAMMISDMNVQECDAREVS